MIELTANNEPINEIAREIIYRGYLLSKDASDRKGLIYGMGHAVYTLSDPRERVR